MTALDWGYTVMAVVSLARAVFWTFAISRYADSIEGSRALAWLIVAVSGWASLFLALAAGVQSPKTTLFLIAMTPLVAHPLLAKLLRGPRAQRAGHI